MQRCGPMERKPPAQSKLILPTKGETAKMTGVVDSHVIEEMAKSFVGVPKPVPRMTTLKVRTEPLHKLSEDERKARRVKNRLKRQKPSQGRTRGRSTWIGKAKEKHKAERREG